MARDSCGANAAAGLKPLRRRAPNQNLNLPVNLSREIPRNLGFLDLVDFGL